MKSLNNIQNLSEGLQELSLKEKENINAGAGFAHDIGTFIRFIWLTGPQGSGIVGAAADYKANQIRCSC
jgi:hypothetical protein